MHTVNNSRKSWAAHLPENEHTLHHSHGTVKEFRPSAVDAPKKELRNLLKPKLPSLLSLCYFSVLENTWYVFPELYTLIGNDVFSWPPLVFCIPMKYQFNSFSCLVIVKRLN